MNKGSYVFYTAECVIRPQNAISRSRTNWISFSRPTARLQGRIRKGEMERQKEGREGMEWKGRDGRAEKGKEWEAGGKG